MHKRLNRIRLGLYWGWIQRKYFVLMHSLFWSKSFTLIFRNPSKLPHHHRVPYGMIPARIPPQSQPQLEAVQVSTIEISVSLHQSFPLCNLPIPFFLGILKVVPNLQKRIEASGPVWPYRPSSRPLPKSPLSGFKLQSKSLGRWGLFFNQT